MYFFLKNLYLKKKRGYPWSLTPNRGGYREGKNIQTILLNFFKFLNADRKLSSVSQLIKHLEKMTLDNQSDKFSVKSFELSLINSNFRENSKKQKSIKKKYKIKDNEGDKSYKKKKSKR